MSDGDEQGGLIDIDEATLDRIVEAVHHRLCPVMPRAQFVESREFDQMIRLRCDAKSGVFVSESEAAEAPPPLGHLTFRP